MSLALSDKTFKQNSCKDYPGERIGYPLRYSWASLVAQMVKILPTVWEMGFYPGLGRPPGGGHGNPLQYSCLENPMDRGTWQATVHSVTELDMTERLNTYVQVPGCAILKILSLVGYVSEF